MIGMAEELPELVLISDLNLDNLSNILRSREDLPWRVRTAPLDAVVQALSGSGHGSSTALVWTRPERVSLHFQRAFRYERVNKSDVLLEVDRFIDMLLDAAGRWQRILVPLWQVPADAHGGLQELRDGTGYHALLLSMNARLCERLSERSNIHLLNSGRWVERAGAGAWSDRMWFLTKTPYSNEVFRAAAEDLLAFHTLATGGSVKLIVLDLDDTLWGGVVGDDGWENLRLGGHDAIGESFVDFQRTLKGLKERGIMLAIASKNDREVALEAMDKHPEMVLERSDFVAMRIDWNDKPGNIADMVRELNIGAQSVLFIDDNPVERSRVREFLPEVIVPEWPANKLLYTRTLRALPVFGLEAISDEDRRRTTLYQEAEDRERTRSSFAGVEEWLASLGTKVVVSPLSTSDLARVHQLFGKTNQFNLTTRRWTEQELRDRMEDPLRPIWSFRVSDRFGDSGLTGMVGLDLTDPDRAVLGDLVMSCRVLGRKVEEAMLHVACVHARSLGRTRLTAELIPTAKNGPCRTFMEASGFERTGTNTFVWDLGTEYPVPATLELVSGEMSDRS